MRLKVPYERYSTFSIPQRMEVGGRRVEIAYPKEFGVRMDFLVCLIDDEYGLQQIRRPVATIADIGANVGFFSLAARNQFAEATIHAYEPNPRIVSYLAQNADAGRFQVYQEAVGAEDGFVSLEDSADSNQARTAPVPDNTATVCQVRLDKVVERLGGWVDLAKIDCEGAEWLIFGTPEPWRQIGRVRMEYHLWGRHEYAEVEQSFAELGFSIHHHHPDPSGEWGTVWARNRDRPPRPTAEKAPRANDPADW